MKKNWVLVIVMVVLFVGCGIKPGEPSQNMDANESVNSTETIEKENTSGETTSEEVKDPIYGDIMCPSYTGYIRNTDTEVIPLKIEEISKKSNQITDDIEWYTANQLFIPIIRGSQFDTINAKTLDGMEEKQYLDRIAERRSRVFYDDTYIFSVNKGKSNQLLLLDIFDLKTGKLVWELDFSDFAYHSDESKENKVASDREISWAVIKENILYVSIYMNGYAQENASYITAVDLGTLQVLWKSESQTCNSNNFILCDQVILSGYGFTAEKDYLYQLDINSGKIIEATPINSMADYLVLVNNRLYVRCYDTDYVFELPQGTDNDMSAVYPLDPFSIKYPIEYGKDVVEKECLVGDGEIRYRFVVVDAACGSRAYSFEKSTDQGKNWILVNGTPFGDMSGSGIDVSFVDESFGFATLVKNGGDESKLYVTVDGGENFEKVSLEEYIVTLEDGTTYNPYDYPLLPVYQDGEVLNLFCGQGYDGDFLGGDEAALAVYQSSDGGYQFSYVESYEVSCEY